jgi:hypothetical protein
MSPTSYQTALLRACFEYNLTLFSLNNKGSILKNNTIFLKIANKKYKNIKTIVKLFKICSAELGDPNRLLFVEKLPSPWFCGVRKKIRMINTILIINQMNFNIN